MNEKYDRRNKKYKFDTTYNVAWSFYITFCKMADFVTYPNKRYGYKFPVPKEPMKTERFKKFVRHHWWRGNQWQ